MVVSSVSREHSPAVEGCKRTEPAHFQAEITYTTPWDTIRLQSSACQSGAATAALG